MITLRPGKYYYTNGRMIAEEEAKAGALKAFGFETLPEDAADQTMAAQILRAHNLSGSDSKLKIRFDQLISHDITFVGILQTAIASGLKEFPVPYALTNCHNSLCAVGGTINEDDHVFGLSAAKKFGGSYVPANLAVIHQYAREMLTGGGKMILGSDSHTRYGALGTMAIGEGGPELVKQLLRQTYDIDRPEVIAVHLTGAPVPGVGPQDVALAIVGAVFENGFVKNRVMEFVGEGIQNISVDYRIGIDVMTTETTCLSSIWETDDQVAAYYDIHGRKEAYAPVHPGAVACYDGLIEIDLSTIRPMIAMPFHPSNVYTIEELNANAADILHEVEEKAKSQIGDGVRLDLMSKLKNGRIQVDQAVIAGCAGGGFENLMAAADILKGNYIGSDAFSMSIYPASQPIFMELVRNGAVATFMETGAIIRSAFCGPCFGAGDVPANGGFSIRHSTRNFPNREGSKPGNGQIASVALMDARSIAATAANKGVLTAATELDVTYGKPVYHFDSKIYENRVYDGTGKPEPETELVYGPNIVPWPEMEPLADDILLYVASEIHDPVTTTDELIPSGETSSYRSNPMGLAEFTLSRKDPAYVGEAKKTRALEAARLAGTIAEAEEEGFRKAVALLSAVEGFDIEKTEIGSTIYAVKPGDGSAREQAASCQRVLGGLANIATQYATKRYRSNVINWGMIPFQFADEELPFAKGDYIYVPGIREAIVSHASTIPAVAVHGDETVTLTLQIGDLTDEEREIICKGCLINYNNREI